MASDFYLAAHNLWHKLSESSGLIFASVVLAFAIWQIPIQYKRYRHFDAYYRGVSKQGKAFFRRQARRRLQIAILAALVGALMCVGLCVHPRERPMTATLAWLGAIFFGTWVGALALADAFSVWLSFGEERNRRHAEKIALEYKMKKFQDESLKECDAAREQREDVESET